MINSTLTPVKMDITRQHVFIGIYRSVNHHILGIIYRANHRYFLMPRQYSGIVKLMPPNTLTVYTNFPVAQFQFHLLHRRPLFQHARHRINLPVITCNRVTQIHHPATFCQHPPSGLAILPDSLPHTLVSC